ncbi:dehydrodolichyl diphosphate synthase complex subunit nus1 [Planococcus citri]|uniref:dehydrodolichyl diphosphate synthase complex subunit nus1 n=1 Tax=Planococcus citri TaxID=170843 RepID=UPI0031F97314
MYAFVYPVSSAVVGFLCRFILNIVHILFFIYLQIKHSKFVLLKVLYNTKSLLTDQMKQEEMENDFISKSIKQFSKLPKHLVFAIGEEKVSYNDLAQLIAWCLPTGVPVISFYDHKDELNADMLFDVFVKTHGDLTPSIKWGVSFNREFEYGTYGEMPCLQVNILTSKYSRRLLIDSIKELSHIQDIRLDDRASAEAALDDIMLSKFSYCANPDLLVISGDCYTTFGLSPWHMGFTEFSLVPSYKLLTVNDFVGVLATYARCDQKFGR